MFKTDVACDLFVKLKVMLIKERLNNMLCKNIVASLLSSKNILILHFFLIFMVSWCQLYLNTQYVRFIMYKPNTISRMNFVLQQIR